MMSWWSNVKLCGEMFKEWQSWCSIGKNSASNLNFHDTCFPFAHQVHKPKIGKAFKEFDTILKAGMFCTHPKHAYNKLNMINTELSVCSLIHYKL